jgi:hypothetical protein
MSVTASQKLNSDVFFLRASPIFAAAAFALNYAEMRARHRKCFVLRCGKFWHRLGVALVVEALIGMIDRVCWSGPEPKPFWKE